MTTLKLDAHSFSSVRDLKGIPARTMQHLHDTYMSWVDKTNEVLQSAPKPDIHTANPIYSELRTFKSTFPGMLGEVRNYECFLSVLGGKGGQPTGPFTEAIRRDFGDWSAFVNELKATAMVSRNWVVLAYDLPTQRLFLHISDGPGSPPVFSAIPLLVLNVSEHAIATDFGRNRMRWIDACLANLDWDRVAANYEAALGTGQKVRV